MSNLKDNSRGPITKRVFYKDGSFWDCDEGEAWERSGDPDYDKTEEIENIQKD